VSARSLLLRRWMIEKGCLLNEIKCVREIGSGARRYVPPIVAQTGNNDCDILVEIRRLLGLCSGQQTTLYKSGSRKGTTIPKGKEEPLTHRTCDARTFDSRPQLTPQLITFMYSMNPD
jgi:hypothetical protein